MPATVIQKDLAAALSMTQRRVQQLLKDGVLIGDGRSSYPLAENYTRYLDFKVQAAVAQAAPTSNDGLNKRREEQLAIRIGREDRPLITMAEASPPSTPLPAASRISFLSAPGSDHAEREGAGTHRGH